MIKIEKYLDIASDRKWWFILPFLLTLLAGLIYLLTATRIYEAQTLIIVQSQKVPEEFVKSIISSDLESRLATITQQVTSRTNLESIINKEKLYYDTSWNIDKKVMQMRQDIKVDVVKPNRRGEQVNAFTISFQGKHPGTVKLVTNTLAANFINENLKLRESQATGTSTFITDELSAVEKRLKENEENLKKYREKYMGSLPEQLETNLRIIERLQEQGDQLQANLNDAENRKVILQTQIAAQKRAGITISKSSATSGPADINTLKNRLAFLEEKYTDLHPDVIQLKKDIAKMKLEMAKTKNEGSDEDEAVSSVDQVLKVQLKDVELQISTFRAELAKNKSQMELYQRKVEATPKREQELYSLERDYDNLKELYNSLLNRKLEAEISVSMERKQKGEQFRIVDPAKLPSTPVKPNFKKTIMRIFAAAIGIGCGLVLLLEKMHPIYRIPEEIENELELPVLVSMPYRKAESELKRIRKRNVLAFTIVGLGFIISAITIVVAVKGIDETLSYATETLDKIGL